MGDTDGFVEGLTQLLNSDPLSDRWNIVLLTEGYQQGQLTDFAFRAQQFVEGMLATPHLTQLTWNQHSPSRESTRCQPTLALTTQWNVPAAAVCPTPSSTRHIAWMASWTA